MMRGMLLGQRDINELDDDDRLQTVVDFYEDIKDKGEGFPVLSYSLGIPRMKQYTARIFIPNTPHVGSGHGGSISNQELASMFFFGKWSGWLNTTVIPALRGILSDAQYRIEQLTSQWAKEERSAYNRSVAQWKRSSEFKRFIKSFRVKFRIGVDIRGELTRDDTIKTLDENNNPITIPVDSFIKISKLHTKGRGWTDEMEATYSEAKRDQWISKSLQRIRSTEEHDPILAQLIADPYKYGAFVKSVIQSAAKHSRDRVIEFILGAKEPDIEMKTKYNRRWRGFPDGPPLKETGDFAESVKYDII